MAANVNLGKIGFTFKDGWDEGQAYTPLDVVTHNRAVWTAKNSPPVGQAPQKGSAWGLMVDAPARQALESDIVLYARDGGSESNKGDSPGQAFDTPQSALNALNGIDAQGKSITIDVGEGSWTDVYVGANAPIGCAGITLQGVGRKTKLRNVTTYQGTPMMTIRNLGCQALNNYHIALGINDLTLSGRPGANAVSVSCGRVMFNTGTITFEGEYANGVYVSSCGSLGSLANLFFDNTTFTVRCLGAARGGSISLLDGIYSGNFTGEKHRAFESGKITWRTAGLCPDNLPGTINGSVYTNYSYIGAVGISKGGGKILGATGALRLPTGAVIASTPIDVGTYEVTLSQDAGADAYGEGTIQSSAGGYVSCVRTSANKFTVYTRNTAGVLTNLDCGLNFYW